MRDGILFICFRSTPLLIFALFITVGCHKRDIIKPVLEVEKRAYNDFFNPKIQLQLARSYWELFANSSNTDEYASSQAISAYFIATVENPENREIRNEFTDKLKILLLKSDGVKDMEFEVIFKNMKFLYYEHIKPKLINLFVLRDESN